MAGNIKRIIKEEGQVLEKIKKEATPEFKSSDGRVVPAQPDRFILKVVSGEKFTQEDGFVQSTVLDYKVDQSVFNKVKAFTPVVASYEISNYGAKAVCVELK